MTAALTSKPASIFVEDRQAQIITDVMEGFGFFDGVGGNKDVTVSAMRNPESYFGQTYEECNRLEGIRIFLSISGDNRLRDAVLSLDGAWSQYTEEQVVAANAMMARTL